MSRKRAFDGTDQSLASTLMSGYGIAAPTVAGGISTINGFSIASVGGGGGGEAVDLTSTQVINGEKIFNNLVIVDITNSTKHIEFLMSGATAGAHLTLVSVATTSRSVTLPDATTTLVGRDTVDTLTNKTLMAPIIATISNTGTLTLPTATDTLVGRATVDTLTNKLLSDSSPFVANGDNTKRLKLDLSGNTTGKTITLLGLATNNRTISLPDASTGLIGSDTVDTLANKTLVAPVISTISNVGLLTLPTSTDTLVGQATNDILTNKLLSDTTCYFVGNADNTKRLKVSLVGSTGSTTVTLATAATLSRTWNIPDASDTFVGKATTDTLTNKTLTAPIIATISNTGTLTLPTSTDTLVGKATTDTLTNKTLTAPIISTISNTGTLTLPTSTDTLVGKATTDTLTNKTLTAPIISTISNTGTVTLPTATTTLVGLATSDTLSNKTLDNTNLINNVYSCRIARLTSQTVTNASWTQITGLVTTTVGFDTSPSANMAGTDIITIRKAGYYMVSVYGMIDINTSTGGAEFQILLNGTTINTNTLYAHSVKPTTTDSMWAGFSHPYKLALNDVLRLYVYQDSGSSQALGGTVTRDELALSVMFMGI